MRMLPGFTSRCITLCCVWRWSRARRSEEQTAPMASMGMHSSADFIRSRREPPLTSSMTMLKVELEKKTLWHSTTHGCLTSVIVRISCTTMARLSSSSARGTCFRAMGRLCLPSSNVACHTTPPLPLPSGLTLRSIGTMSSVLYCSMTFSAWVKGMPRALALASDAGMGGGGFAPICRRGDVFPVRTQVSMCPSSEEFRSIARALERDAARAWSCASEDGACLSLLLVLEVVEAMDRSSSSRTVASNAGSSERHDCGSHPNPSGPAESVCFQPPSPSRVRVLLAPWPTASWLEPRGRSSPAGG
mmetsp:Transcript_10933/g.27079  ORF Transcript_10933/g.27079 Transcript_10933/m.27079 type:complete len:303 (-) Transcript_10933:740-1648(-)